MAQKLNLDDISKRTMEGAAILHDLGKLGIPDHILRKKGAFSKEEFEIMKQHVIIGEDILKPLRTMNSLSDIVRHHHESYDGSGYPDKLHADEIPLLARILSVAEKVYVIIDGKVVTSQGVEMLWAEENEIRMQAIKARIPTPELPFASLRLVKDGKTFTEQSLHPSSGEATSQALVSSNIDGNILQWGYPDIPALVRFSSDGGQTYTTLEIDVLGGEIILDPNNLPIGNLLFQIILADQNSTQINLTWENKG